MNSHHLHHPLFFRLPSVYKTNVKDNERFTFTRVLFVAKKIKMGSNEILIIFLFVVCACAVMSQPPPMGGGTFTGPLGNANVVAFSYNRGFVTNANSNMRYIRFQNQISNVNADFRMEYGTFVCQLPGVYFFTFSALTNADDDFRIALKKNFDTVATAYGHKLEYTMASQSAILNLRRGDLVYLQVEEGTIFESSVQNRAYASFSGFLITPGEYDRSASPNQNPFSTSGNNPMLQFDQDGVTVSTDIWKLLGLQRSAK